MRIALLALWITSCALPAMAADTPRPPATTTAPVAPPAVDKQREIRAQLAPRRYTTLSAEIGLKISRLPVPEGGAFKQGQALILFDCSLQQAQHSKAKAALSATETTWKANKRLDELNSIGKVELQTSEAEVLKAKAEVASAATMLSKCSIAAPFSGRISEQKVREQQYVQPGQPLLEILDDSALELEFLVPSKWLAWIHVNSAFQVRIDETAKTYPAKVQRIGAKVDPVSQSVKLTAVVDGKFAELIAGMSGKVLITPPAGQ